MHYKWSEVSLSGSLPCSMVKLECIDIFSLNPGRQRWFEQDERSRLVIECESSRVKLYGDTVVKQFSHGNNYLIITLREYFDCTGFWFYYLSDTLKTLDCMHMSPVGTFEEFYLPQASTLQFMFLGSPRTWQIQVLYKPTWSIDWQSIHNRLNWFALGRRYLHLNRLK